MKQCPQCRTPYYDDALNYCQKDGTPLRDGPPSGFDTQPSTLILPSDDDKSRIRILLRMEIENNLSALDKYDRQARARGKGFNKAPIGHALVLDGFRYNDLPKLNRDNWLSLLPSLPKSDLSTEELRRVHTFYKQLENLELLKKRISIGEQKMDKEREMEKLLGGLIREGNPLSG